MKRKFESTHGLGFKGAPQIVSGEQTGLTKFEVGTCRGLYKITDIAVEIHAVINDEPGNGHMDDVFEWFEGIAKHGKVPLVVLGASPEFKIELSQKRDFLNTNIPNRMIKFF